MTEIYIKCANLTTSCPRNLYQIVKYGGSSIYKGQSKLGKMRKHISPEYYYDADSPIDIITGENINKNCIFDTKPLLLARSVGSVFLLPVTISMSIIGVVGIIFVGVPSIIVNNLNEQK
jgi:hypothetical protein